MPRGPTRFHKLCDSFADINNAYRLKWSYRALHRMKGGIHDMPLQTLKNNFWSAFHRRPAGYLLRGNWLSFYDTTKWGNPLRCENSCTLCCRVSGSFLRSICEQRKYYTHLRLVNMFVIRRIKRELYRRYVSDSPAMQRQVPQYFSLPAELQCMIARQLTET